MYKLYKTELRCVKVDQTESKLVINVINTKTNQANTYMFYDADVDLDTVLAKQKEMLERHKDVQAL